MKLTLMRMTLRLFFLLTLIGLAQPVVANDGFRPLEIIINFPPPYPRDFAAYFNNPTVYSITIINHTDQDQEVYLLAELRGLNNGVLVGVDRGFQSDQVILVPARAQLTLTGEDVSNLNDNISLGDLIIQGVPATDLNLNGVLPEGMYQFCINAYDYNLEGVQPLSVGCGALIDIFYGDQITIQQPPFDDYVVPFNPSSVFTMQWDPNIADAMKRMELEYELKLIDLTEYPDDDLDLLLRDGGPQAQLDDIVYEEIYLYNSLGTDIELEVGHQYAMRVRAVDPMNEILFPNDGYSEIRTFWYGEIPAVVSGTDTPDGEDESPVDVPPCAAFCEYTETISQTPAANAQSFSELQIGLFTIEEVDYQGAPNGATASGTGMIRMPWLGVDLAVEFSNVSVNSGGRIFNGEVTVRDDSDDTYSLTDLHSRLELVDDYLPEDYNYFNLVNEHLVTARMVEAMFTTAPVGMPLGISETIQGRQFTLMFTDFSFTPTGADMDMVAFLDFTNLHPNLLLPLVGSDLCVNPGGPGGEGMLNLTQNLPAVTLGGLDLTFHGVTGTNQQIRDGACYLEYDCDGLRGMAIHGDVAFDRDMILPDNSGVVPDEGEVHGYFDMNLDRNVDPSQSAYAYQGDTSTVQVGTHLMLGYTMDPFQLKGLDGWSFLVTEATLDLSDLENPETLIFPTGYGDETGTDTTAIWQGFHLKQLALLTPPNMTEGSRRSVSLNHLIIDTEPSLSVAVSADSLISVESGNLEGWGFALDSFYLTVVQNTLINGGMVGRVSTPLIGSADYLRYRALINQNEAEQYVFNAIATPDSLVSLPMLVADAALCPNSFIQFKMEPDETQLATFLTGQMSVNVTDNLPESLANQNLLPELSIRLADFQFNYNTIDGFVTEGDDGSRFGFGLDLQTAVCGTSYTGPMFVDTDEGEAEYSADELGDLFNFDQQSEAPGNDASPQETVSGFPISIDDFDFTFEANHIDLRLTVGLHLSGEGDRAISGGATVGARSTLVINELSIKKFSIDSLWLECIYVGTEQEPINLDFMTIHGQVCFKDYNGGKGFEGSLGIGLAESVTIDIMGGFGKYGTRDHGEYGTSDFYGWWYIDGSVAASPLAQFGPIQFNMAGGGIYWNVDAPALTVSVADVMAAADGEPELPPPPSPQYGARSLAFRCGFSIIDDNVVTLEPIVALSWDHDPVQDRITLSSISIGGDFWVVPQSYASRDETYMLKGESMTSLTFSYGADNVKRASVQGINTIKANIIPDIIYGAGPDKALVSSAFAVGHESLFQGFGIDHSDPDDTYWFFNAGNPYEGNYGGITFSLPAFSLDDADNEGDGLGSNTTADIGAGFAFYLMTGQNIPSYLPDPPGRIEELFGIIDAHADRDNGGSFDGGDKEDERDASATQTGSGLVMGAHIQASAEVNAVLYANFAILSGLDVMMFKYDKETSCITEGGQLIENIGANGWYGTGRAYAGLEGAIGAKGKILGKEIDVQIMHLVAAVMLEAGGPKPMYLEGRAGVYFNLLNGFIEGSARMKIDVGDRCQPIGGNPFGFPVIVDSNPSAEGDNEHIEPFIRPKVSFSIPLSSSSSYPTGNSTMQAMDTEGNIFRRFAYVHTFTVEPINSNANVLDYSRNQDYPLLIQDGRAAEYRPVEYLSGPIDAQYGRNWRMRIVIRAKERMSNGNWVSIPGENGQGVFEEILEVDFHTDPLPEQLPDSEVGITRPLRYQHFYLQDEGPDVAYMHTRVQLENSYFANTYEGESCTYEAIVINTDTREELSRETVVYAPITRKVIYFMPELENQTQYTVYVIRKLPENPFNNVVAISQMVVASEGSQSGFESEDIDNYYAVNADVVEIENLVDLRPNEIKVFEYTFRTSAHNTVAEKMAGVELLAFEQDGYQDVIIGGDYEGFDAYEIFGKQNEFGYNFEDEEQYRKAPLIRITDPFQSNFHNTLSKPLLGSFMTLYQAQYADQPNGLETIYSTDGIEPLDVNMNLQFQNLGGNNGFNLGFPGGGGPDADLHVYRPVRELDEMPRRWPQYIGGTHYNWGATPSQKLNAYISPSDVRANSVNAFNNPPSLVTYPVLTYNVTHRVLDDAERLIDFFEAEADFIRNYEAYQGEFGGGVLLRIDLPDRREMWLEDLEDKYLDIVNSDLHQPIMVTLGEGSYNLFSQSGSTSSSGSTSNTTSTLQQFAGIALIGDGGSYNYQPMTASDQLILQQGTSTNFQFDAADVILPTGGQPANFGFSNSLRFIGNRSLTPEFSAGSTINISFDN